MKYSICLFSLLFLLLSNQGFAGLISWPSHSYSLSRYFSKIKDSNVQIEDCSNESYILSIDTIKITPEIVTPGAEVTLEAEGYLSETIEQGAEAHVIVKLGVVTLIRKTFDLCKTLEDNKDKVDLQCPIERGKLKITQKITLPKEIPKGDFRVFVEAYNYDDADLACIRVHADFRKIPRNLLQFSNPY